MKHISEVLDEMGVADRPEKQNPSATFRVTGTGVCGSERNRSWRAQISQHDASPAVGAAVMERPHQASHLRLVYSEGQRLR